MRKIQRLAVDPVDAQESIRVSVALLGIYGLLVGALGLFSDVSRYNTSTYQKIIAAPGGILSWALFVLVNSVVLLVAAILCKKLVMAAALFLGALWTSALAIGFFAAYLASSDVSALSYTSLGFIAALHCQKCWITWSSRHVDSVRIVDVKTARPVKDKE